MRFNRIPHVLLPRTCADDPTKEKSWFEKVFVGKAANLALAIVCSKMMVPLKLPVALALTPYAKRWVGGAICALPAWGPSETTMPDIASRVDAGWKTAFYEVPQKPGDPGCLGLPHTRALAVA